MRATRFATVFALLIALAGQTNAAITTHTSDFIADGSRSHFNGFESIPNSLNLYTGGSGPYIEDSIQVQQINGDPGNSIMVEAFFSGSQGNYGWYPSSGDEGYTQVGLVGGGNFDSIGFNYGTGFGQDRLILVELLDDGNVVLTVTEFLDWNGPNYVGFSGGGFDTIRMRDLVGSGSVTDGAFQALAIDNIETQDTQAAVPEPATLTIWGLGALGCAVAARRRKKSAP